MLRIIVALSQVSVPDLRLFFFVFLSLFCSQYFYSQQGIQKLECLVETMKCPVLSSAIASAIAWFYQSLRYLCESIYCANIYETRCVSSKELFCCSLRNSRSWCIKHLRVKVALAFSVTFGN